MKPTYSIALACALGAFLAIPMRAQAQYRERVIHERVIRIERGGPIRELVDRAERESNDLRYVYEHNYGRFVRDDDDDDRDDRRGRFALDLKASIQRMDEAFERLRRNADDRHSGAGREDMSDVLEHSRDVDRAFSRRPGLQRIVGDRWRFLRDDIDELARRFDLRRDFR